MRGKFLSDTPSIANDYRQCDVIYNECDWKRNLSTSNITKPVQPRGVLFAENILSYDGEPINIVLETLGFQRWL